ncbi:MAG: Na(+)-translocating NADH-quinone reductase subunit A [Candidatus Hydrogenedentales bacterium]
MAVHTIRKGLDLPIAGVPDQTIHEGAAVTRVALIADDYIGLKPTMFVKPGDKVLRGQPLCEDKKNPGVMYTAPAAGTVTAVNRGERRALQSIVIELGTRDRNKAATKAEFASLSSFSGKNVAGLSNDEVRALLVESGMWTAFRTRPYSKVPAIADQPAAIFITAMDTNPLAPNVDVVYKGNEEAFAVGLHCIAKLRDGRIYLCRQPGSAIGAGQHSGVQVEEFKGVHPAGNAGTHIHFIEGASRAHIVWYINYQDVISIGKLFTTGRLDVERVISLAGPSVLKPRLIRTRFGASTDELTQGELEEGEIRVISGSVLSGRIARGDILGYLGRFHHQISALREGREREFLGWLQPGGNKFSIVNVFSSNLVPGRRFKFNTNLNGSARAMVPIGTYEKVMPLDIVATHLLRSLIVGDVEAAEQLGCLELDEEDLALCTFVCPGKYDYGPYLRSVLTTIEREG